jgi:NADPH:quinone reductase-like Zn-dependent oxidoreductase
MSRAVRYENYGDVDVLNVVEVEDPVPGAGQLLVRVKAAGINPGEAKIRDGMLAERWPSTFPSGQGSDLAGVVEQVGEGVDGFAAGDEVIGFTDERASQAELVAISAENATPKPAGVSWDVAGSLFVAGATAWASVRAVSLADGDTVVISGAAGGVGVIAVQLARRAGATVIGLATSGCALTAPSRSPTATGWPSASASQRLTGWTRFWTWSAAAMWSWPSSWAWRPSGSTRSLTSPPSTSTASSRRATPSARRPL